MKILGFVFIRVGLIVLLALSISGCENKESNEDESFIIQGWNCIDNTCYLSETLGGFVTTYNIEEDSFSILLINPTDQVKGTVEYDYRDEILTIVYNGDSNTYTCPFYSIDECNLSIQQEDYVDYSIGKINDFVNSKDYPKKLIRLFTLKSDSSR